jgi:hypothetical protein
MKEALPSPAGSGLRLPVRPYGLLDGINQLPPPPPLLFL